MQKLRLVHGAVSVFLMTLLVVPVMGAAPEGVDTKEPLGISLGKLALKFAAKLRPPFTGHDEREAKQFLARHIPPIVPIGGWDREEQAATRGDLIVLIVEQLRLPVPEGQEGNAAAYCQTLLDFAHTAEDAAVLPILGLWRDTWIGTQPDTGPFQTESQRPLGVPGVLPSGGVPPFRPRTPI